MNEHQPTNDLPIDDAWAERLSAYHDGELTAAERAEVETRLSDDKAGQRWLAELGSVSSLCQEAIDRPQWRDVSKQVLSEAARRQAELTDAKPLVASQADARSLEPDGDFGLPFGRSSRGWMWAGVAAAAAIMIGYVDRPAQQPSQNIALRSPLVQGQRASQPSFATTPVGLGIDRMRKAVPGLRVVRVELTPEGRKQFVQSLARNGFGFESNPRPALPQELAAARRAGLLVEPLARGPMPNEENDDQLMFVSAEAPRYSRLIQELEKDSKIYRVEADPIELQPNVNSRAKAEVVRRAQPAPTTPISPRVIRFRMKITPQVGAAPKLEITQAPTAKRSFPNSNSKNSKGQEITKDLSNEELSSGEVVRGEEALPDTTIAKQQGIAGSNSANKEVARRQGGRVPVVFVVKMRVPE